MDQEILLFQPTTSIREDLSSLPFVRFYMQEDIFISQDTSVGKIQLPFNQFIHQIVNSLTIMNKVIANNSKTTTSFIENGKDIFNKKKAIFYQFMEQYTVIHDALQSLEPRMKTIFINTVMALSNLILKLSINMAKISIILINKFNLPSYLNIFTVSIIFQKFLEYKLLLKRQGFNSLQQYKSFIKQYPKISIVKLQKVRNPFDIQLIQKSQDLFLPQHFRNEKNMNLQAQIIQYLQLFEEDLDGIYEKSETYKSFGKYSAFDLKRQFGLQSPFSFQLYLLFNEVILNKMIQFKPDIIIYIEDYDSNYKVMDSRIRGMILNQFSSKVQNKIYIFKQFGLTSQLQTQKQKIKPRTPYKNQYQFPTKFQQLINSNNIQQQSSKIHHALINLKSQYKNMIKQFIQNKMKQINQQNNELNNDIIIYFNKIYLQLKQIKIDNQALIQRTLNEMHKVLLEDLTYLSLALIQKSNFEQPVQQYRNYIFKTDFLQKMIIWMIDEKQKIKKERPYAQPVQLLKNKIQKLKGMIQMSLYKQKQQLNKGFQTNPQNIYKIYNLKTNKLQQLKDINNKPIQIQKSQNFHIIYYQTILLLIIFGEDHYEIYRKLYKQSNYLKIKEQRYIGQNIGLKRKYSTFVYNNKYLYKAFGQFTNQQNIESVIYRFNIQNPLKIQQSKWESLGNLCFHDTIDQKNLPPKVKIQLKKYGYGFSYDIQEGKNKCNIVLFGGGFNYQIQNQQKVNRYFYIIKDNSKDIRKIGKSNPDLINQSQNLKSKTVIYPFIYGIPLKLNFGHSHQIAVLNFNGYHENVNHFKKIFLTKIKFNQQHQKIGIVSQNRMIYREKCPEVDLANKNMILSCLMNSYNKINRLEDRVVLYNAQNQPILLEITPGQVQDGDKITVKVLEGNQMMEEQHEQTILFFGKKRLIT